MGVMTGGALSLCHWEMNIFAASQKIFVRRVAGKTKIGVLLYGQVFIETAMNTMAVKAFLLFEWPVFESLFAHCLMATLGQAGKFLVYIGIVGFTLVIVWMALLTGADVLQVGMKIIGFEIARGLGLAVFTEKDLAGGAAVRGQGDLVKAGGKLDRFKESGIFGLQLKVLLPLAIVEH